MRMDGVSFFFFFFLLRVYLYDYRHDEYCQLVYRHLCLVSTKSSRVLLLRHIYFVVIKSNCLAMVVGGWEWNYGRRSNELRSLCVYLSAFA